MAVIVYYLLLSFGKDANLSIEVHRNPPKTDQFLLFDSHQPLEHKLGVIWTLKDLAQKVSSSTEGKQKELTHIKTVLKVDLGQIM